MSHREIPHNYIPCHFKSTLLPSQPETHTRDGWEFLADIFVTHLLSGEAEEEGEEEFVLQDTLSLIRSCHSQCFLSTLPPIWSPRASSSHPVVVKKMIKLNRQKMKSSLMHLNNNKKKKKRIPRNSCRAVELGRVA